MTMTNFDLASGSGGMDQEVWNNQSLEASHTKDFQFEDLTSDSSVQCNILVKREKEPRIVDRSVMI